MESFKVLISVAFLVACALAVQAIEPEEGPIVPPPSGVAPPHQAQGLVPEGPSRTKKQALLPLAYASYPYAAYPYYQHNYPYAYSYQYYDDGKYWPGKYEKAIPYKAAYPYSYYPYNHYYYY